jgi:phosphoglycolate phosphatase
MHSQRPEVVIFDWDGTLMNSEARIVTSVQQAALQCGFPVLPHDQSKQIIGLSLDKAILHLYPEAEPPQVAAMAEAYTQHFLFESGVDMQPYDGAVELLSELKAAGFKLAVATGKSRKGLNEVLSKTGFGEFFDITRTPVESASKPDPLMLQQILAHFNLSVSQAVMVGDTTFDMQMAKSIAMPRVALTHGVHSVEQMQPYEPDAFLDDLFALKDWILR